MDREVSWGDEAVEEQIQVPVRIDSEPKIQSKKELATPKWSVDTRGDFPIERALGSQGRSQPAALAAPDWPEEETTQSAAPVNNYGSRPARKSNHGSNNSNNNKSKNNSNESFPPLIRRDCRAPVPGSGESRSPRENGKPRGNDSNGAPGPSVPRRKFIEDLSTLNLPGVDLSKMPSSSTPLPFTSNNNNRLEPREDRNDSYERSDSYEKVNRATREVEEMGWGDESEPVRAFEPVRVYEPVQVSEPVRQLEPAGEPVRQAAPVKAVNDSARLDDDGWGDEPESVSAQIAEPVKVSEPIRQAEPVRPSEPISVRQPEPVKATEPATTVSASSDSFVPTSTQQAHIFQPMAMSAHPQFAQMSPSYIMPPHNPMSPVGQMPMPVPMSCMSGMMMPFWVTCPFCYHCYMYPPVVPGSGPAPGAATLPSNTQQQQSK